MGSVHRPGPFKQTNKSHKTGRHRSKGTILTENKGSSVFSCNNFVFEFTGRTTHVNSGITKAKHKLSRLERRNQMKQVRTHKQAMSSTNKKDHDTAPPQLTVCLTLLYSFIIQAIISFDDAYPSTAMLNLLTRTGDIVNGSEVSAVTHIRYVVVNNATYCCHFSVPNFRQRHAFICPDTLYDCLDALKVVELEHSFHCYV